MIWGQFESIKQKAKMCMPSNLVLLIPAIHFFRNYLIYTQSYTKRCPVFKYLYKISVRKGTGWSVDMHAVEFCETTRWIKCRGWIDGRVRTARQCRCVPGSTSLAASQDADNGASQKWGWRTGKGLSFYTFLIVHGFVMIMYYLGNEKIKIKRIRWKMQCFACNVVLRTLFTLSPIFSLLCVLWLSYAE